MKKKKQFKNKKSVECFSLSFTIYEQNIHENIWEKGKKNFEYN